MLSTSLTRTAARVGLSLRPLTAVQTRGIHGRDGDVAGGGGSFGKKEKALEEQFFRQQDADRLKYLKSHPELLEKEKKAHVEAGLKAEKAKDKSKK